MSLSEENPGKKKYQSTLTTLLKEPNLSSRKACADPEGGGDRGSRPPFPPEKSQKIGFLSNSGLDPLKNHKAIEPAFNVGPSSAHQQNAI